MMIWHADTGSSYRSGCYLVHWGIKFWTAWTFGAHNGRRIGDASTQQECMKLCERDEKSSQTR